jgi:hypothetical protein
MRLKCALWFAASTAVFVGAEARAAEVAVMPVSGVNLSEGDCDAIGVLFANAFARDARVAVASPLETAALREDGRPAAAIAAQLGAVKYVELDALQLGQRVKLGGVLYAKDGARLFQAETTAPSLEAMDVAIAALAHALAFGQPIALPALPEATASAYEPPPAPEPAPDPNAPRGSYGVKLGFALPHASGKSFAPGLLIQFDGRLGPRNYFLEFGAGLVFPTDDQTGSSVIRLRSGYLELGGSYYLWEGNSALYLGAGLSPALWQLSSGYDDHTAATCAAYAQVGVTFTRNSRAKIFGEFRLYQLLIGVANPINDGTTYYTATLSDSYRPMVLAFQGGVVF